MYHWLSVTRSDDLVVICSTADLNWIESRSWHLHFLWKWKCLRPVYLDFGLQVSTSPTWSKFLDPSTRYGVSHNYIAVFVCQTQQLLSFSQCLWSFPSQQYKKVAKASRFPQRWRCVAKGQTNTRANTHSKHPRTRRPHRSSLWFAETA